VPAPLHIGCGLLLQRAQADCVQLQFKARSDLGQLHTAVAGLPIYMVPEARGGRAWVTEDREQMWVSNKQQWDTKVRTLF